MATATTAGPAMKYSDKSVLWLLAAVICETDGMITVPVHPIEQPPGFST